MMVAISSYTANLAAFITLSAVPQSSVSSIAEAVLNQQALCNAAPIWSNKLYRMFPSIFFAQEQAEQFELGDLLVAGEGCDGLVMAKQDYLSLRGEIEYCTLEVAETVFPSYGAWITNAASR